MSGKLIHSLKRKAAAQQHAIPENNYLETCDTAAHSESDESGENSSKRLKIESENENSQSSDVSGTSALSTPSGRYEFLMQALHKIEELEDELAQLDDDDCDSGHHEADDDDDDDYDSITGEQQQQIIGHDAEAIGFAVCVREAFNFLSSQGISDEDPLVLSLRERLIGQCHDLPFEWLKGIFWLHRTHPDDPIPSISSINVDFKYKEKRNI